MCILPSPAAAVPLPAAPAPARALPPPTRQRLALHALAGTEPSARLAQDHHVTRNFVYQQADKAQQALDDAFVSAVPTTDEPVLFHLPVTKAWLRQLTLGLLLIGHSSLRGVTELLRDLFDYPLAVGTVPNIVAQAVPLARRHNQQQDLAAVRIGAHAEIFPNGWPVLVGADVDSTYCYLLSLEEHRDAATWGVRLLELHDRGFRPAATIADAASGLRAGQELALRDTPCRGAVFPALQQVEPLARYLENRA